MIADPPSPYRTTGIQDSVRSILRGSVLGRLGRNSDGADNEEETIQVFDDVWENPRSPFEDCHLVDGHLTPTETMPINTSKPASFVTANGDNLPANPLPTHALSTRISLLSHSELETNLAALGLLNQQEVRRHGRSNHNQRRRHDRHKHLKSQDTELRILYVVISGLLLTGLLSTCKTLPLFTTSQQVLIQDRPRDHTRPSQSGHHLPRHLHPQHHDLHHPLRSCRRPTSHGLHITTSQEKEKD